MLLSLTAGKCFYLGLLSRLLLAAVGVANFKLSAGQFVLRGNNVHA